MTMIDDPLRRIVVRRDRNSVLSFVRSLGLTVDSHVCALRQIPGEQCNQLQVSNQRWSVCPKSSGMQPVWIQFSLHNFCRIKIIQCFHLQLQQSRWVPVWWNCLAFDGNAKWKMRLEIMLMMRGWEHLITLLFLTSESFGQSPVYVLNRHSQLVTSSTLQWVKKWVFVK